jgi:muconolactone delta-isomerase
LPLYVTVMDTVIPMAMDHTEVDMVVAEEVEEVSY